MRRNIGFAVAVATWLATSATAGEPLVIELPEQVTVRGTQVLLGDVAKVSGATPGIRAAIARLDLIELKRRDEVTVITPRVIDFRLKLAEIDPTHIRVVGATRTTVTVGRRSVTAEEVEAAARKELLRLLPDLPGIATVELAQPIVVKLPEVPTGDVVTITATPNGKLATMGRVQMNVAIIANDEKVLSFPVYLELKPAVRGSDPLVRLGGLTQPGAPQPVTASGLTARAGTSAAPGGVVIRARQQVKIRVRSGALLATADGQAQEDGALGQTILVQNVDSKKLISARVTGPALVDIELRDGP